jgi:hypothetical protein
VRWHTAAHVACLLLGSLLACAPFLCTILRIEGEGQAATLRERRDAHALDGRRRKSAKRNEWMGAFDGRDKIGGALLTTRTEDWRDGSSA